ncbi:hypothetical protein H634G_09398 [Metarhizium anisopliae BRIP 53293]|uniref:Uncharacterized protein n=1 Tax=Metarhizium anisopliae BRIP 53293 TaxID=1291518 RepID=A0A0D9NRW4_METAN|nr:hypothetical protein H634G_09398 [Metarhizium anisopliae BRIP 53293]KJK91795.1 hypothetical protein H633G_04411 [Metarhizium anisopliae BRIP 53284]
MPRGYYLGQGLIPLGDHSSDDEEGPDYSFMDDVLGEDGQVSEDDEEAVTRARKEGLEQ